MVKVCKLRQGRVVRGRDILEAMVVATKDHESWKQT